MVQDLQMLSIRKVDVGNMTKAEEWSERFNKTNDDSDYEEFMTFDTPDGWVPEEYDVLEEEIVGTSRWGVIHEAIIRFKDNSYMQLNWQEGATEYQDGHPKSYSAEPVEPYDITITKYRSIK